MTLGLLVTTRLGVHFQALGRPLDTASDVDRRIELLRRTSMRSMIQLSAARPTWVLQTDPTHLSHVRSKVEDGTISVPAEVAVHVVPREDSKIAPEHLEALQVSQSSFLSLRLDSDDYYFREPLLEVLRDHSGRDIGTLVDFRRGYFADLENGSMQRHSYLQQGPFYGVIANADNPIPTIESHVTAREGRSWISVGRAAWIQTIHGHNDSSSMNQGSFVRRAREIRRDMLRSRHGRPLREVGTRAFDLVPVPRPSSRRLLEVLE